MPRRPSLDASRNPQIPTLASLCMQFPLLFYLPFPLSLIHSPSSSRPINSSRKPSQITRACSKLPVLKLLVYNLLGYGAAS